MRAAGHRKDGPLGMLVAFFLKPEFSAVCLHRLAARTVRDGQPGKLAQILRRLNLSLNGCDIDARAVIGPGFVLPHPAGVVLGPVTIGANVTIHQNVTMGRRRSGDEYTGPASRPRLGDGVIVYAGAVIVGGVRIGDNARIGANAVVAEDVPDGGVATVVPAVVSAASAPAPRHCTLEAVG